MQGGAENRIDDEAARWVAREDRGPLPPEELAERDRWLPSDRKSVV